MCSLGHGDTTMCRGENYLRMNPQPTTEMFYRYCLKPMAPWDIYYGGQPGSPCGAVKRGPAQFQVALPIETQVYNSRKVVMWGRMCAAGHPRGLFSGMQMQSGAARTEGGGVQRQKGGVSPTRRAQSLRQEGPHT